MTDQDPDPGPEEERVRALLADLGSGGEGAEPLPADVAARLDVALERLVTERTATPLRARSRWAPRLAAGAAAVVVLGLGGLVTVHLSHSGDNSTADSAAGGSSAESQAEAQPSALPSAATPPSPLSGSKLSGSDEQAQALPELTSSDFARGATRLLDRRPALRAPAAGDSAGARASSPRPATTCVGPSVTDGASVTPVVLDSSPAALVVHPAAGGKRLVEAWSCDGTHRFASTTITP